VEAMDFLPHGVLFRGGAEERIRTKLLKYGDVDTLIGLPANLFFSTGIPVCIIILKKCKKFDDVLFINASGEGNYEKGKRQNRLLPEHIDAIVETYKNRLDAERYYRKVSMEEIEKNDYKLNISRYVSTSIDEEKIDLAEVNQKLVDLETIIKEARDKHNGFLRELGLAEITIIQQYEYFLRRC
jgi:type I restriction enzyme M protein